MIWVRIGLIIYALIYLVGGYFLIQNHSQSIAVGAYLLINGTIIIMATLFERGRYQPKSRTTEGWELTNERFVDDVTGKTMRVKYNRQTGERKYVEEDAA